MTTVSGTYENGRITLDEETPIKARKAKVHVTFVEEIAEEPAEPKRQLGRMKGTFTHSPLLVIRGI